jgi:hypothetical protein
MPDALTRPANWDGEGGLPRPRFIATESPATLWPADSYDHSPMSRERVRRHKQTSVEGHGRVRGE